MQNSAQRKTVKFDTFLQLVLCIFPLKVSQIIQGYKKCYDIQV